MSIRGGLLAAGAAIALAAVAGVVAAGAAPLPEPILPLGVGPVRAATTVDGFALISTVVRPSASTNLTIESVRLGDAAVDPAGVHSTAASTAIALVVDRSTVMGLANHSALANASVQAIARQIRPHLDRLAVVSFGRGASSLHAFTDFPSRINHRDLRLDFDGPRCTWRGALAGLAAASTSPLPGRAVVLVTTGPQEGAGLCRAHRIEDAIREANAVGAPMFVIQIGADAVGDAAELRRLADETGGGHWAVSTAQEIGSVAAAVVDQIARGQRISFRAPFVPGTYSLSLTGHTSTGPTTWETPVALTAHPRAVVASSAEPVTAPVASSDDGSSTALGSRVPSAAAVAPTALAATGRSMPRWPLALAAVAVIGGALLFVGLRRGDAEIRLLVERLVRIDRPTLGNLAMPEALAEAWRKRRLHPSRPDAGARTPELRAARGPAARWSPAASRVRVGRAWRRQASGLRLRGAALRERASTTRSAIGSALQRQATALRLRGAALKERAAARPTALPGLQRPHSPDRTAQLKLPPKKDTQLAATRAANRNGAVPVAEPETSPLGLAQFTQRPAVERVPQGPAPFALVGTTSGKYRLETPLGRGGLGEVYRARDLVLDRPVAIKVLSGHSHEGSAAVDRLRREAGMAAQLNHPNVVVIHEIASVARRAAIVMEYIDGQSLAVMANERGLLSDEEFAPILESVAAALDAAQAQGLIHGDVKPSNILVGSDGQVKLCDFGIARRTGRDPGAPWAGTPQYVAPEVEAGEEPDPRADIYSLGALAVTMLTGRPDAVDVLPMAYATVLKSALEPDPNARCGRAGILAAAFRVAVEKERLRRRGPLERLKDSLRARLRRQPVAELKLPPLAFVPWPNDTASLTSVGYDPTFTRPLNGARPGTPDADTGSLELPGTSSAVSGALEPAATPDADSRSLEPAAKPDADTASLEPAIAAYSAPAREPEPEPEPELEPEESGA